MSKPIALVRVFTGDAEDRSVEQEAVFDTGSHYTIVREHSLPPGAPIIRFSKSSVWGTACREPGCASSAARTW